MQPTVYISNPMVAGIVAAIVIGIFAETVIFRASNPLAAIPALLGGYLVYRFASWSGPFWAWFKQDGFLQLSAALVVGACVVTAVWLLRNRIPTGSKFQSDEGLDESFVPAHALPKVVYHGTPSHSNAKDIADKLRFLASDGRFYVTTDLDYAKAKAGSNGTILKCEVMPWAKLKQFGGHYYYEHHGSCNYQRYYPLRGLKPTHYLPRNQNY